MYLALYRWSNKLAAIDSRGNPNSTPFARKTFKSVEIEIISCTV